ncbi:MAG: DNA-binding response regulator [Kangiella sp.]|nr:MAG: DNA-binding response regulator [Kangiella sp.]
MKKRLLIVEDDENLRSTLADNLELEGFDVSTSASVAEAKLFLTSENVDLIILDIMLPDGNGFELCEWIRQRKDVLILMLTARNLEKDLIKGFVSGTDDYLSKPYRSAELLLRIKALLRRTTCTTANSVDSFNGFQINWEQHSITKDSKNIHLTKTAFSIFSYLFSHLNKTCSRDEILNSVWGEDVFVDNRTVDNFVSNLKKSLSLTDGNQYQLKTIRGIGYSLYSKL